MRLTPRPAQLHTVLALLVVVFPPTCSAIPGGELAVLLDFANTTSVGWNTTNTAGACSWSGVVCRDDTVVKLHLGSRGLTGHLPESIGNLTHLERFDVGRLIFINRTLSVQFTGLYLFRNDFYGLIPPAVAELCAKETTRCEFSVNNRLCGDGERVLGYTCSPCPLKANCAANGEYHNGFNSSDYFCSTCPSNHFDAGGSCVECVGGAFGVVAPVLLFGTVVLIIVTTVWFLKRLNIIKEHHVNKVFNLNMDTQTKAKQGTTVVQVLSEASKFNNLPFPPWLLSFSLFATLLTLPFQPQPACVTDIELPSYQIGIFAFLFVEFIL
ncbi:hypothetical protein TrST_g8517 [Triparma strigata]|uniref:Leucine-rich repeat-containing N-terminal plant-type domain-containing protein n=1 Tax=Triparma strigata TaxID=1606541 RepID=A0A9W7BBI0_9STRA|nr:hypothetical protein TrST_g8517 [Triparma strigata]